MPNEANIRVGIMTIAAHAKESVTKEMDIEEKARVCFEMTFNNNYNWFTADKDDRFQMGIGALATVSTDEEMERIKQDVSFLKAVNAASSGVPVDMGAVMEGMSNPIGLQRIFMEVMAKQS
jgi:hypothetical protein